eukprot:SAG31_NODE_5713_length_2368_cov_2.096518_3_plen_103_part_00
MYIFLCGHQARVDALNREVSLNGVRGSSGGITHESKPSVPFPNPMDGGKSVAHIRKFSPLTRKLDVFPSMLKKSTYMDASQTYLPPMNHQVMGAVNQCGTVV